MDKANDSLLKFINPKQGSTVMIYDVHASESGALAILDDLYNQIRTYKDKSIKWVFVISTPRYKKTDTIIVRRFPWVKKNWGFRFFFDAVYTRKLLKEFCPDQVVSLQNKAISFFNKRQIVYLHQSVFVTDHQFKIRTDGVRIWIYQHILCKIALRSFAKADTIVVQTQWMKSALVKKKGIREELIKVFPPDITCNGIGTFQDSLENRRRFFYPAMSYTYKNHMTLLKALKFIQDQGMSAYELILTIHPDENRHTKCLENYIKEHKLHVSMRGLLTREEVLELYTRSVLVFPSYLESYGMPLLEARLTGTYILASDCPFCHEILSDYSKVKYFKEMDYKELGRMLMDLNK